MSSEHTTYSPKKVSVKARNVYLEGWADGDFITAERTSERFSMKVGADGAVCRVENADESGTITFKVMASSSVNAQLQALAERDDKFAIFIKDNSGNDKCFAEKAWCRGIPKMSKAKDDGVNEWPFDCAKLEIKHGGNDE